MRRSSRSEPAVGMGTGPEARATGLQGLQGYLDPDAGRAFPTLWGKSWDGRSSNPRKPALSQSFMVLVSLTLPDVGLSEKAGAMGAHRRR